MRTKTSINKLLAEIDQSINDKEFVSFVFSLLEVVRDLAIGEVKENVDGKMLDFANNLFLNNQALREEIYIRCTTNTNLLEVVDYEILTKRNKKDYNKIETFSSLINIRINNHYGQGNENSKHFIFEVSKNEICNMIETLQKALKELCELGDKHIEQ